MEIKVGDKFIYSNEELIVSEVVENKIFFTDGEYEYLDIIETGGKYKPVVSTSAITPSHYNSTKIDALSVIDDWSLDFYLGNVVKYIQRHGKKDSALQDLEKAAQYLQLKIQRLKGEVSE